MKQKKPYKIGILALLLVVTVAVGGGKIIPSGSAPVAHATSISDAKKKVEELEKKKKELAQKIEKLKNKKADILDYIEELDGELADLADQIDKTTKEIDDTEVELEQTKVDLEEAKRKEEEQYANMKVRIQYMYENGETDYIDILLSAGSLSDLLNRTEYIEQISAYDNSMYDKFVEAKKEVEAQEAKLEVQLQDLETMKEELTVEQDAVQELADAKNAQLKSYESQISAAQADSKDFTNEIAKQEALVERLLEEQRKKQEEAANAGTGNFNPNASATGFRWPLGISGTITSSFGYRNSPTAGASSYHQGVDIAAPGGTPIYAANSGTVTTAGYSSGAGNYVMIYHSSSTYTIYMHCSKLAVSAGAFVDKGQVIGYVGSTGISTGNHLHFGVSVNGSYVNPMNYVSR